MTLNDIGPAYAKALAQLPGPKMLGVVGAALLIALVITAPLLLIILPIAAMIDFIPTPAFLGSDEDGSWLGWSSWLFWTYVMSPLAVAIVSMLLDQIVEAVEARHYPGLQPIRRRNIGEVIGYAIKFLGLMAMVSIGALLIAWLTPVPGWIVFTGATGYLVAREYYETVALRRLVHSDAKASLKANLGTLWPAGLVIAAVLNVPVLNLIAPIVGVAAFTHLFHRA